MQHDWKSSINAALTITGITGAVKGTSLMKIYKGLGFESLKFRRWFRRVCLFYKLRSTQTPKYILSVIHVGNGIIEILSLSMHYSLIKETWYYFKECKFVFDF